MGDSWEKETSGSWRLRPEGAPPDQRLGARWLQAEAVRHELHPRPRVHAGRDDARDSASSWWTTTASNAGRQRGSWTTTRCTSCSWPTRTAGRRPRPGLWWRKNTNQDYCGTDEQRPRCVDLNRNFEFEWGCCGGSPATASAVRSCTRGRLRRLRAGGAVRSRPTCAPSFRTRRARTESLGSRPGDTATGIYHGHPLVPVNLVLWPWGYGGNAPNLPAADHPGPEARVLQRLHSRSRRSSSTRPTGRRSISATATWVSPRTFTSWERLFSRAVRTSRARSFPTIWIRCSTRHGLRARRT